MKKIPRGIPCLIVIIALFGYLSSVMGFTNMLNTIMRTAHDLLLNTVFYLMAMCVLTGALSRIFSVFGVVDLLQKMLKPVLRPLFNLPGVSSAGALMTFLSDKPAIISVAKNPKFARYFKRYQHISLVNFAGSYAMGLLVIIFMMGHGFYTEPLYGLVGAIIGSIIATRLMQRLILKECPQYKDEDVIEEEEGQWTMLNGQLKRTPYETHPDDPRQTLFVRVLDALLDGGKSGVEVGLAIIPGVLIISTLVMILTFGPSADGTFTGAAYEGIEILPALAGKIDWFFNWVFGLTDPHQIAFPITALGAVGAALSLVPNFVQQGWADGNAIAVFTAIGMCWSGYLSTHTAMLDSLGYRELTPKAIIAHTIGGICAALVAHWTYMLFTIV